MKAALLALTLGACASSPWPQAAGPNGNFHANVDAPERWSVAGNENIAWRAPLPGPGQGGIAIAGGKLFLTVFDELAPGQKESNAILGLALDARDGRQLWSTKLRGGRPSPIAYAFSDATSWTPVTDGARVVFFNAAGEMAAFMLDGRELWRRRFRDIPDKYPFNRQLEPVLWEDLVITIEPKEGGNDWNYLHALDIRTGKIRWIAEDATTHYNTPVAGRMADGRATILHGRGGPHDVPERPVGLTMTSLTDGRTIWRFVPEGPGVDDGVTYQALYTMVWDPRHVYWWKNAPEESHLIIDANTGLLLREQSLVRHVDIERWQKDQGRYVRQTDVDLREVSDDTFPLKPGEALHVFPQWHANMVAGGYHWFFASTNNRRNRHAPPGHSGPAYSIGRVNIGSGKVEYLEVPVAPGHYGQPLKTRTLDSRGRELAAEDRSRTDGWQIAAFFPTPVVLGDRLYMSAMLGVTYVFYAMAARLDDRALLAVGDLGPLGETWSLSGPSYADGRLYHRSLTQVVAIGGGGGGGGSTPRPIVDTHIHFYKVDRSGTPWPPKDASKRLYRDVLPAEYRELARKNGVTACGIVEASPRGEDNRWILDLIRNDDLYPFFVASLDVGAPDFALELDRLAKEPKVVGVRAYLWNPEITLDAQQLTNLRALAARGMTLDIVSRGTKNPKDKVVALAKAVPDLRIIIDHLAGAKDRKPDPAWERDIKAVAAMPNVHMKFSSFFDMFNTSGDENQPWQAPTTLDAYKAHFDVLMKAFGAERLIWGSNWPVSAMGGDFATQIKIAEAYLAPYGTKVRDQVMAGNARAFYKRSH